MQTMAQSKVAGEGIQMALKWFAAWFSFAKVAKILYTSSNNENQKITLVGKGLLSKFAHFQWKCTKIPDFQWEVPFSFKRLMGAVWRLLLGMGK